MRRISSTNKHPRTIGLYTGISHWSTVLSTDSFFHCHRLSSREYALWNKKTAAAKDSGRKPCLEDRLIISCMSLVITEKLRITVAKMTSLMTSGYVEYRWVSLIHHFVLYPQIPLCHHWCTKYFFSFSSFCHGKNWPAIVPCKLKDDYDIYCH
jgi:hypothetical protein